jgi:hypothetical protein
MTYKFPKQQNLRQESERGCSVPVFAKLAGISKDELLTQVPEAALGKVTHLQWKSWLETRFPSVVLLDGCPTDTVPCAHLVGPAYPGSPGDYHWIYRDSEGDVYDPSGQCDAMPADHPDMRNLVPFSTKVLTITVPNQPRHR